MKKIFLVLIVLLFTPSLFASYCSFDGKSLYTLKDESEYDVEFAVKTPLPPKIFEVLEKYFGKFSKEKCRHSIVITKITNKSTKEYYWAFYTNENKCDGGNSYGVIVKGSDTEATSPVAIIEDSYFDCL